MAYHHGLTPAGEDGSRDEYESSFRLNHRLPWDKTHAKVMQGTADVHHQIANARLPYAARVVDDAAAL